MIRVLHRVRVEQIVFRVKKTREWKKVANTGNEHDDGEKFDCGWFEKREGSDG